VRTRPRADLTDGPSFNHAPWFQRKLGWIASRLRGGGLGSRIDCAAVRANGWACRTSEGPAAKGAQALVCGAALGSHGTLCALPSTMYRRCMRRVARRHRWSVSPSRSPAIEAWASRLKAWMALLGQAGWQRARPDALRCEDAIGISGGDTIRVQLGCGPAARPYTVVTRQPHRRGCRTNLRLSVTPDGSERACPECGRRTGRPRRRWCEGRGSGARMTLGGSRLTARSLVHGH
jgi:hypothetical protein